MRERKQPIYSSEKGRVDNQLSIDEKIAKAKRELKCDTKPSKKSFSDKWEDIKNDLKKLLTIEANTQTV